MPAIVAEFEADLARMRTREGMRVARAPGRLKGKQLKLSRLQEAQLLSLVEGGSTPSASSRVISMTTTDDAVRRTACHEEVYSATLVAGRNG